MDKVERPLESSVLREDLGPVTVIRCMAARIVETEDIQTIGDMLYDLVDREDRIRLVLDLGAVELPASAFWGKVLWLVVRLRKRGGRLALCNLSDSMLTLFRPLPALPPEGLGFFDSLPDAIRWAGAD